MTRFILLIIIAVTILSEACTGRKPDLDDTIIIPEKDLISILTEVHIADGLLTITKIRDWYSSLDSLSAYSQIIEKHGYSKETMDKTMKYYFIKNPGRLINIYDKVLGILSEMETYIEKQLLIEEALEKNLWDGERTYSFPESFADDSGMIIKTLFTPGIYNLTFTATMYPDDQSLNPRIITYACNADSLASGKKYNLQSFNYIKDGQPHDCKFRIEVPTNIPTTVICLMLVLDNNPNEIQQNALIENVSIVYLSKSAL